MRNAAMRADRARGWSLRKIAKFHRVSLAMAHRVAGDVHIMLPGKWHKDRCPAEREAPARANIHLYLYPFP